MKGVSQLTPQQALELPLSAHRRRIFHAAELANQFYRERGLPGAQLDNVAFNWEISPDHKFPKYSYMGILGEDGFRLNLREQFLYIVELFNQIMGLKISFSEEEILEMIKLQVELRQHNRPEYEFPPASTVIIGDRYFAHPNRMIASIAHEIFHQMERAKGLIDSPGMIHEATATYAKNVYTKWYSERYEEIKDDSSKPEEIPRGIKTKVKYLYRRGAAIVAEEMGDRPLSDLVNDRGLRARIEARFIQEILPEYFRMRAQDTLKRCDNNLLAVPKALGGIYSVVSKAISRN